MFIARELKETNIAEYLLYLWQVEDLIRAAQWDLDRIDRQLIRSYQPTPEQHKELLQWYSELIQMMREEHVWEKGHLQICKNVMIQLTDLHWLLLNSPKYPFYAAAYYKALPILVELRAKGRKTDEPELETCFEALYGLMLLRLQKKEVSEATVRGLEPVTKMISMLANYHKKQKDGEFEE